MLRRSMTGILNRLSGQTKDTTWRAVKALYDQHSVTICNTILRDSVQASCVSTNQLRSGMIPDYAAVITALHFTVGKEVGAFIVEHFTKSFIHELDTYNSNEENKKMSRPAGSGMHSEDVHEFVTNKRPINYLLVLIYLYNLRILHHTLIVDIMTLLSGADNDANKRIIEEHKIEMIVCIIDHCGFHLRADDPVGLNRIVTSVMSASSTLDSSGSNGRMKFLLDALADLKNNKSRRTQGPHKDTVQALRKWIGSSVKSTQSESINAEMMSLHVSLQDLLNAEGTGRWWLAGASWKGLVTSDDQNNTYARNNKTMGDAAEEEEQYTPEQLKLLELAKKLRFTTATRKSIFLVTMSSHDVHDAFERILKLRLPGNSDREIIRVLLECCAQEKVYNPFYADLMAQFCKYNRQHKTTVQYSIYDFMKILQEEDNEDNDAGTIPKKKIVNTAKLFCHLVYTFDLPLSMMKRVDLSNMNDNINLFLSTFFISMFTSKVRNERFKFVL
jgi:nucleolar MIF4G domain-containing protein 1